MAKLIITADYEPDPADPMSAKFGPEGLVELLMPFGLDDIDITVKEEGDED